MTWYRRRVFFCQKLSLPFLLHTRRNAKSGDTNVPRRFARYSTLHLYHCKYLLLKGVESVLLRDDLSNSVMTDLIGCIKQSPLFVLEHEEGGEMKKTYVENLLRNLMEYFRSQTRSLGNLADEAMYCGMSFNYNICFTNSSKLKGKY